MRLIRPSRGTVEACSAGLYVAAGTGGCITPFLAKGLRDAMREGIRARVFRTHTAAGLRRIQTGLPPDPHRERGPIMPARSAECQANRRHLGPIGSERS